jgi:hypothetical protein
MACFGAAKLKGSKLLLFVVFFVVFVIAWGGALLGGAKESKSNSPKSLFLVCGFVWVTKLPN